MSTPGRPTPRRCLSPEEIRALPAAVRLWPDAGQAFGLSRSTTFELARRGEFPVPVLRLGRRQIVTRAALLQALGITDEPGGAA